MKTEGVKRIIVFNRHFYFGAISLIFLLLARLPKLEGHLELTAWIVIFLSSYFVLSSIIISFYIYDFKQVQSFEFLKSYNLEITGTSVNIHAGYDDSSSTLMRMFPSVQWRVMDFFNPAKHTEKSLHAARRKKMLSAYNERISTDKINAANGSLDRIFLLFSAHEIRDSGEMNIFFHELHRIIADNGKVIITEHPCNMANFLAYGPGVMHFWTEKTWLNTFNKTGFKVVNIYKYTPWVKTYIIAK